MNEKTATKMETIAKTNGHTDKSYIDFIVGFSEGYNNFKTTVPITDAYRDGHGEGMKEFARLDLAKSKRKSSGKNKSLPN